MTRRQPIITDEERRLMSLADAAARQLTQTFGPRRAIALLSSSVGRHAAKIEGPIYQNTALEAARALFAKPTEIA